jgi:penicillin amidase
VRGVRQTRRGIGWVLLRLAARVLGSVFAAFLGLIALAGVVVAGLFWLSLPPAAMQVQISGLSGPVAITLDADGIPRIAAGSDLDAAAALGFMHARDRIFQMELMRRAASGRLSEIAGGVTLRLDRTMRVLGLRMRAEADLPALDADARTMLEAYAAGVNAWIAARGRLAAPEFIPLGMPEPWTAVDSLLWGKTMGLYLSGNWRSELARAALQARLPIARLQELWPPQDDTPRPDARALPGLDTRLAAAVPGFPEPFTWPSSASNEWAVDGSRTTTGHPLLAGDPHLGFNLPAVWYLARIDTPSGVLVGATAPGVPFLVVGHNGRIAWTFTTTGADTQDVFVETVLPDGRYQTPGGPQPFVQREERIRVRGAPDERLVVRETRHGPVLSDLDASGGPVLAVAMANLAPGDTTATGLLALNRASDVAVAGRASELVAAPVQNLLAADRTAIAQFTTGRVPIRRAGDGTQPVEGADGAHDWTGYAGGAALPRIVAPAAGRLVNANERVAGPDFPVFMGADWFGDWRARRIRQMLAASDKHDTGSFAAMQVDAVSSFAVQILPALLATRPADEASERALAMLSHWDGGMRPDLPQPLIFNAWVRQFESTMLARAGVPAAAAGGSADLVARALSPGGAGWCEGDCGPMLAEALKAALAGLAANYGAQPDDWRWGSAHQAIFSHPLLGTLPVLGRLTTSKIVQPGDDTTVYRGGMRGDAWASVHGAGYRGVYDLDNLDRSLFALTPGQSGNPFRRAATSLMARWRDGTSIVIGPQPAAVADRIGLVP